MIISIRALIQRLRFIAIFLVGTYIVMQLFNVVSSWVAPVDKYREPQGRAVKVFHSNLNLDVEPDAFRDRLMMYYWLGE